MVFERYPQSSWCKQVAAAMLGHAALLVHKPSLSTTFLRSSLYYALVPLQPLHHRPFPNPRNLSSFSASSSPMHSIVSSSGDNVGGGRSGAISPPPIEDSVQKIDVNPPRGTRDFPPEDMRLRNWLFHHFREVRVSILVHRDVPFILS